MSRKKLAALGLLDEVGLTGLGSATLALDRVLGKVEPDPPAETAPANQPAKNPRKSHSETPPANECGCGCGEPCKGLWRPGHDARWAGATGRTIAAQAPITAGDDYIRREATRAAEQIGASEALAAKVLRVAQNHLAKAAKRKAA
jgi:hypothetical protein